MNYAVKRRKEPKWIEHGVFNVKCLGIAVKCKYDGAASDRCLQGNDTTYGLAAAAWTRDISRAHAVARKLRAGTVWFNCYMAMDPISPFGGYKHPASDVRWARKRWNCTRR
jgi:hypothetical protein